MVESFSLRLIFNSFSAYDQNNTIGGIHRCRVDKGDDNLFLFCKKKFKGISRAIYQIFQNQQSNSAAILNTVEKQQGEEEIEALFWLLVCIFLAYVLCTCAMIADGSTKPYSDNTCPQCGKDTSDM